MQTFKFGDRELGEGNPPFIIAEIGSNHNGDMDLCRKMVDAAKESGADAAKFQSFSNSSLISTSEYNRRTDYGDTPEDKHKHFGSLKEMVDKYQFTPKQHHEIADYCRSIDIEFMSTPFSAQEVDLLEDVGVSLYKVASMDVNHPELLSYIASKNKPVILSTGMADLGEIEAALATLDQGGAPAVAVLHCVSVYPPAPEDIHLNNIPMLANTFNRLVGFSDHTIGTEVPKIALSLGAQIIEKHFTTDKGLPGWDHAVSATPEEMSDIAAFAKLPREEMQVYTRSLTQLSTILGQSTRIVSEAEFKKRAVMRRCCVAASGLKKGHRLTLADLDYKRPGSGIHPNEAKYLVGRELNKDVPYDHELAWDDFL